MIWGYLHFRNPHTSQTALYHCPLLLKPKPPIAEAFMEARNKEIEGDFAVSDGGGGTGCLRYKEPPEP